MKKAITYLLSAVITLSSLTACGAESGTVAVKSVSEIVNAGSIALVDRYAGIVVSGESAEIKKDEVKKVLEIRVAEGDMVSKGDVLFSYDTEAMQLQLEKLRLEYEELQNKKLSAETSIPDIKNRMRWASAADQLGYTLQIQSLEADILESTYNMSIKEREISAMEAAMENVDVVSPISGRIMSVNEGSENPDGNYSGEQPGSAASDAFITITDVATFRIKGTINEMNVGTLSEGMPVIIRSRLDNSKTWSGMLEKIDWETTVNSGNMYYGPSDEMTSTTKYPFYVAIEDFDGLLLGQHVYIEPDYGQSGVKSGLWLPAYYIVHDDSSTFVWAQNSRSRIEKRQLTLGEEDPENGTILIVAGLSASDSLAFPEDEVRPGMICVPYEDTMFVEDGAEYYPPETEEIPGPDDGFIQEHIEEDTSYDTDMNGDVEPYYPDEVIPEGSPSDGGLG